MAAQIHLFWFRFENPPKFSPLALGCGVSAYGYEDALKILADTVFAGREDLKISQVIKDVDVGELDGNHVLPNMGLVARRGVWFPQGF